MPEQKPLPPKPTPRRDAKDRLAMACAIAGGIAANPNTSLDEAAFEQVFQLADAALKGE